MGKSSLICDTTVLLYLGRIGQAQLPVPSLSKGVWLRNYSLE